MAITEVKRWLTPDGIEHITRQAAERHEMALLAAQEAGDPATLAGAFANLMDKGWTILPPPKRCEAPQALPLAPSWTDA